MWCHKGITTACFILIFINNLEEGVTSKITKCAYMPLNCLDKLRKLEINKNYINYDIDKLVRWSENGRCYSILGNVNIYTQGREIRV